MLSVMYLLYPLTFYHDKTEGITRLRARLYFKRLKKFFPYDKVRITLPCGLYGRLDGVTDRSNKVDHYQ